MDLGLSEYLTQDAGIAGVGNVLVDGVSQEIEKGLEQGVTEFFGGLFGTFTESVQSILPVMPPDYGKYTAGTLKPRCSH